ncbi:MAG: Tetratricopeptide 2 repeat protein [Planctomycetaceae bacterium]|nr:Tetratricopeptide 2 repeat protein [Planctomycetaceae bacterium]
MKRSVEMKYRPLIEWRGFRGILGPALCLFGVAVLVYSRALWCDFVLWDDPDYVLRNRLVQSGFSVRSLWRAMTTFECANWHPLTWLSLMLDFQLYGLRPWGFHLTNVLLHGLNSALLFVWLTTLSAKTRQIGMGQVWFIAAVFAVHPVHVESVAWISERKDVLATFFGLLSLLAYQKWMDSRQMSGKVVGTIFFAMSLCAKPLFVTLPCVLVLVEFWPLRIWGWSRVNPLEEVTESQAEQSRLGFFHCAIEKWPLFLLSLISCVTTIWAQQQGGAVHSLSQLAWSERFRNAVANYGSYLVILIWPVRLCAFYPLGNDTWSNWRLVGGIGAVVFVSLVAIALRRRCPGVLMGWFWFLGTLVPMIGLVQVGGISVADRYLYVPLIGVTIAVVIGSTAIMDRMGISAVVRTGLGVTITALLCGLTWQQIGTWSNTETLARRSLEIVPDNWNGHLLLATVHEEAGRWTEAEFEYDLTLKLHPTASTARNNLAILMVSQGRIESALEHYRIGLDLKPRSGLMRMNFANALSRHGQVQDALVQYELACHDELDNEKLFRNYGSLLIEADKPEMAVAVLERAVELAPRDLACQLLLARAVLKCPQSPSERWLDAESFVEKIANKFDCAEAHLILAEVKFRTGIPAASQVACEAAMKAAKREKRDDLLRRGENLMSKTEQSRK